jgi:acetyl esterase/lipase
MAGDADIIFAHAGGMDLKLDIYRPAGSGARTAILYLHGGSWRVGSKERMRPAASAMAGFGHVGLTVQYRLTGQSPWPAQIHDVKAAIRWTRAHAEELDIDPERIVLWGSSAGAHLALLAAGTPDDPEFDGGAGSAGVSSAVAAVVAVHAPTSFFVGPPDRRHSTPASALMGDGATEAAARAASPLSHVSERFPPTLLLHGTQDRVVHHSASQRMLDALRAVRAPADLHLFHGHGHGFAAVPSMRAVIAAEAAFFLDRTIVDPERYRREIDEYSAFAGRPAPNPAAAAGA